VKEAMLPDCWRCSMTPPRIFVSHDPKDVKIAWRLIQDLRRAGAEPWDYVTNASDSALKQHIDEAIAQSDWLVLVLSPDAIASHGVRAEVEAALLRVNQGSMRGVIAFLVAPCEPSTIPPQWAVLRRYDAIRDYASALADLLHQLGLVGAAPQEVPPALHAPVADDDGPIGDVTGAGLAPPVPSSSEPTPPPAPAKAPAPEDIYGSAPAYPSQLPSPAYGLPPDKVPPYGQASPQQPPSPPASRERSDEESTATRVAPPSTATLQFSAYHPSAMAVETWNTLLVYTYIAEVLAQVQADAATFTELGSAPTVAEGQATRAVARGVELTIEPHMEGVTFSPASDTFVWRDDWRRSLFRCTGAAALAGTEQPGWIDIYAHPMVPIARIDLSFRFHEARLEQLTATRPRGMIITSNMYDSVFISYSHSDSEAFRQARDEYRRFGITIYTDEQLEAGAQYEHELSQMIAAAKVFHLLWSRHAAASPECRKEWLSALRREPTERFIKPWFWKQPLIPPPSEFSQHRISFKYEPLKRSLRRPSTWFL
jgi:TIR domain